MVTLVLANSMKTAKDAGIIPSSTIKVSTPNNVDSIEGLRVTKVEVIGTPFMTLDQYRTIARLLHLSKADKTQVDLLDAAFDKSMGEVR